MGYFKTAHICLNGHCLTSSFEDFPEISQPFCSDCGSSVISACPVCHAQIRGDYCEIYDFPVLDYQPPSYCHSCGKPYPWTQTIIDTAAALIFEEEELSAEQQKKLVEVLPDIMSETPKTRLAATRMKKALLTVGQFTAEALRSFVIDFGCELAKRELNL